MSTSAFSRFLQVFYPATILIVAFLLGWASAVYERGFASFENRFPNPEPAGRPALVTVHPVDPELDLGPEFYSMN